MNKLQKFTQKMAIHRFRHDSMESMLMSRMVTGLLGRQLANTLAPRTGDADNRSLGRAYSRSASRLCALFVTLIILPFSNYAAVLTPSSGSVNTAIPDNDSNGITSVITVSGETDSITDLKVTLNLSASGGEAFNGDYYAYLTHDTINGFAVLLNRPGKTAANSIGTDGAGFTNVVFDDDAGNGDVHVYETTLGAGFNAGDALTGTWAPDARNIDPANVLDTDSRTAHLSSFDSQVPNGEWTLFIADMASGGSLTLSDWSMEITIAPVPEPQFYFLMAGASVLTAAVRRHRRQNTGREFY